MHLITSSPHHGLLHTYGINPPGSAVPQASWWYRRAQRQDSSNGVLGRWGLQAQNIDSVDFPRRWWEDGSTFFQKKGAINQIQLLLSSMSVDVSSLLVSALMWGGKEDVTATCWMNERFWLPICSTYCLGLEREILALLMSLQEICTLHVGCLFYTYASTQCSLKLASG